VNGDDRACSPTSRDRDKDMLMKRLAGHLHPLAAGAVGGVTDMAAPVLARPEERIAARDQRRGRRGDLTVADDITHAHPKKDDEVLTCP
jgi:hypothetical protein